MPEARYAIAHGRMNEGQLEQVMLDFWNGEYDVLVATTIIESGLDLPQVNTLIVERADLLGLAQLYQLRGRVGRSTQRAYAYLFHPEDGHAQRGRLPAAGGDRRVRRPGFRVPVGDARPGDPGRRQHPRQRAVGPHQRGRIRSVLRTGGRGRRGVGDRPGR